MLKNDQFQVKNGQYKVINDQLYIQSNDRKDRILIKHMIYLKAIWSPKSLKTDVKRKKLFWGIKR